MCSVLSLFHHGFNPFIQIQLLNKLFLHHNLPHILCPLSCSWRGFGRRVRGVQYQTRGLWFPQGEIWVWGYSPVQQPAVLCYSSRTSDPCSVPHHGLRAPQGARRRLFIYMLGKCTVSEMQGLICFLFEFLTQHGVDSDTPLPYSHIDIAGSSGPFPGVPTGAPILAMTTNYILSDSL